MEFSANRIGIGESEKAGPSFKVAPHAPSGHLCGVVQGLVQWFFFFSACRKLCRGQPCVRGLLIAAPNMHGRVLPRIRGPGSEARLIGQCSGPIGLFPITGRRFCINLHAGLALFQTLFTPFAGAIFFLSIPILAKSGEWVPYSTPVGMDGPSHLAELSASTDRPGDPFVGPPSIRGLRSAQGPDFAWWAVSSSQLRMVG